MERRKRGQILAVLAILALAVTLVSASTVIFWSHTTTKDLTVLGISSVFTPYTYDGYRLKTDLTVLPTSNQGILSVLAENFYGLWTNLTFAGPVGLIVTCTGQYVDIYWTGPSTGTIQLVGTAFEMMGYHEFNETEKAKLKWTDPGTTVKSPQPHGYGILLTYSFDTEDVLPGTYTINLKIDMGHT